MWGRPLGFCNILCLPSVYLFSIPRESLPLGFIFTPWSQPAHRTINMAPAGAPGAIPALHSLLPPGSGGGLPSFNLHWWFGPSLPSLLPHSPEFLFSCYLSSGSGHLLCLSVQHPFFFFWWQHWLPPGEPPLLHPLRCYGASNHTAFFLLTTVIGSGMGMWPKPGQSESSHGIFAYET